MRTHLSGWLRLTFGILLLSTASCSANNSSSYRQGLRAVRKGDYQSAIARFGEAIRQEPTNPLPLLERGRARFLATGGGAAKAAIADYTAAIRLAPYLPEAYRYRGAAYLALGRPEPALADYTRVIELEPENAEAYFDRGKAYWSAGDQAKARTDFARAARLEPDLRPQVAAYSGPASERGEPRRAARTLRRTDGFALPNGS
jgi:tetratricopeptide (TPR) repeat protein